MRNWSVLTTRSFFHETVPKFTLEMTTKRQPDSSSSQVWTIFSQIRIILLTYEMLDRSCINVFDCEEVNFITYFMRSNSICSFVQIKSLWNLFLNILKYKSKFDMHMYMAVWYWWSLIQPNMCLKRSINKFSSWTNENHIKFNLQCRVT